MRYFSELYSKIALPESNGSRTETIAVSVLYTALAAAVTAVVIYGAFFGGITALVLRSVFYSMVAMAGLLAFGLQGRIGLERVALYLLALVAIVPGPYM